ncbi:hypothetical protein EDD86DRAFT_234740, partial [Gorgonomyces haynaldii]
MFECRLCPKGFKNQSKLDRHMATHSENRQYQCDTCSRTYKRKEHLTRHQKTHKDKEFKCTECDAQFHYQHHLKRHMSVHIPRLFNCPDCTQSFTRKALLTRHQKEHQESPVYHCAQCSMEFPTWSLLMQHTKSHLECHHCGQTFTKRESLNEHLQRYKKDREIYECSIDGCLRTFMHRRNLKAHIQANHEQKRFHCDQCDCKFGFRHVLERHMKTHSSVRKRQKTDNWLEKLTGYDRIDPSRSIPCTFSNCSYRFTRVYDLERHQNSFH